MEGEAFIELSEVLTPAEFREFAQWIESHDGMVSYSRCTPEFIAMLVERRKAPKDLPSDEIMDKLEALL